MKKPPKTQEGIGPKNPLDTWIGIPGCILFYIPIATRVIRRVYWGGISYLQLGPSLQLLEHRCFTGRKTSREPLGWQIGPVFMPKNLCWTTTHRKTTRKPITNKKIQNFWYLQVIFLLPSFHHDWLVRFTTVSTGSDASSSPSGDVPRISMATSKDSPFWCSNFRWQLVVGRIVCKIEFSFETSLALEVIFCSFSSWVVFTNLI